MNRALVFVIPLGILIQATWAAAEVALPAQNPWVAASPYPMSHHNPTQTDVTIIDGPTKGRHLTRADAKTAPVILCSAPIVKKVGDHTTFIAGTPHGLAKIDATGEAFDLVSFMPYPGLEEERTDVTHADLAWHMARVDERRRNKQDWRLLFESVYLLWGGELGRLSDDPRSRAISCSLVYLGPEAPASQAWIFGTDKLGSLGIR